MLNNSDLSVLKRSDLPLIKDGESGANGGVMGGQLLRVPLMAFNHNSQALLFREDADDIVPAAAEGGKVQRVSNTPRVAGDSKLKDTYAIMAGRDGDAWRPLVSKPKGALKSVVDAQTCGWLHEGSKLASRQLAELTKKAMQKSEFSRGAAWLEIVALKRRDKGAHSESHYGLDAEGKDRGEGFPFWATTWERALKAAAGDEAVVDALYAMAAWVFQEAAAELTETATELNLLHDSRARHVLVLYRHCQKEGAPARDHIGDVMRTWGKGKELRLRRNADAGHPFLFNEKNTWEVLKERVEDFGDELMYLSKKFEGYGDIGRHGWLVLKAMVEKKAGNVAANQLQQDVADEELRREWIMFERSQARANLSEEEEEEEEPGEVDKQAPGSRSQSTAAEQAGRKKSIEDLLGTSVPGLDGVGDEATGHTSTGDGESSEEEDGAAASFFSEDMAAKVLSLLQSSAAESMTRKALTTKLNGLRRANNKSYSECAKAIWRAGLRMLLESTPASADAAGQLKILLEKWGPLLQHFLGDKEDGQTDLLLDTESAFETGCFKACKLHFIQLAKLLYDEDIVAEEAFNLWEAQKEASPSTKQTYIRECAPFMKWLQEADEEASSEDDQ